MSMHSYQKHRSRVKSYRSGRVEAFEHGVTAARDGKSIDENPYPLTQRASFSTKYDHFAACHKQWRAGWMSVKPTDTGEQT